MNLAKKGFIYASFCVGAPSLVLYLAEIYAILRQRHFHTPFYGLFVIRAIGDILQMLASFYGYRFLALGYFGDFYLNLPTKWLVLMPLVSFYSLWIDNLATTLMLLNRLSAIRWPIRHKKIWPNLFPLIALLVFTLPIPLCIHYFAIEPFLQTSLDPETNNSVYSVNYKNTPEFNVRNWNVTNIFISHVCFAAVCLLVNALTLVYYKRHVNLGHAHQAVEHKLTIYAIATFVGHLVVSVMMILNYALQNMKDSPAAMTGYALVYAAYPFYMDCCTMVMPSLMLLWSSPKMRRYLGHWYQFSSIQVHPTTGSQLRNLQNNQQVMRRH